MTAKARVPDTCQEPKRIPLAAAKRVAREHGLRQVILLGWDGQASHVVTFGVSAIDCDQAAQGGDLVKRAMGWPESKLGALPSRVRALQKRVAELEGELAKKRAERP